MAIKIIKQGQVPAKREFVAKCINCKTEVEFLQEDGEVISDQRDGDYISIRCPMCNHPITKGLYDYKK